MISQFQPTLVFHHLRCIFLSGGYTKFTDLKNKNKNLKTLLAIGGWNEGSSRFSKLVASKSKRTAFAKNVAKFLRQNDFDGLDINWQYPTFRSGDADDKDNFVLLIKVSLLSRD